MTDYRSAAAYLTEHASIKPEVGIICGSGLSGLHGSMTETQTFGYDVIPGFPLPTVAGHTGELVFGRLSGVPTVCMRGRFHFYEGHAMTTVVMPTRVMRCLGVKVLIVTNAAGGINSKFSVGDVMVLTDHFSACSIAGANPLMGPNDPDLGPRFMPVSNVYDPKMQQLVVRCAKELGFGWLRPEGCYAMVSGPSYESPTECRFLKQIGCDTVGMSTVPEIIAAHHSGMKVIGLSLVTNKVVLPGEDAPAASHAEVLESAAHRAKDMMTLIERVVRELKAELPAIDLPRIDLTPVPSTTSGRNTQLLCAFSIGIAAVLAYVMRTK